MYRNQGVWGDKIQLGNPFMEGAHIGQMLGGMRGAFAQANLQDQQTLNQPVIGEGYGLNNDLNRLKIKYYPQEMAIDLSKAWNDTILRQQQGRFSDPDYLTIQWLKTLPKNARAQYIQSKAPDIASRIQAKLDLANNGNYDPGKTQAIQNSFDILGEFTPQRNSYNDGAFGPMTEEEYMGAFGNNNQEQSSGAFNNSPNNFSRETFDNNNPQLKALNSGINTDVAQAKYAADQNKRIQAGQRLEAASKQATQFLPGALEYTGGHGWLKEKLDAGRAITKSIPLIGDMIDNPSPSYQELQNWRSAVESFLAEYKQVLGSRSTDTASKEIEKIGNPEFLRSNPDIARATWAYYNNLARQMEELNQLPIDQQIKKEKADEILKPRNGLDEEFGVWWINGKAYTLNQLKQMKEKESSVK